jgi:hypothetical protein
LQTFGGNGLLWGYTGSGPDALAALLGRLLDDITSRPATRWAKAPEGLLSLIQATSRPGTTVYDRAQLLAARAN